MHSICLDKYNIKHLLQIPRDIININRIWNNILDHAMAFFVESKRKKLKVLVAQLCPTLGDPMDPLWSHGL